MQRLLRDFNLRGVDERGIKLFGFEVGNQQASGKKNLYCVIANLANFKLFLFSQGKQLCLKLGIFFFYQPAVQQLHEKKSQQRADRAKEEYFCQKMDGKS